MRRPSLQPPPLSMPAPSFSSHSLPTASSVLHHQRPHVHACKLAHTPLPTAPPLSPLRPGSTHINIPAPLQEYGSREETSVGLERRLRTLWQGIPGFQVPGASSGARRHTGSGEVHPLPLGLLTSWRATWREEGQSKAFCSPLAQGEED